VPHWQHDIDRWRVQTRRRLRHSPKLASDTAKELGELYRDTVASTSRMTEGQPRPPMPAECPWTLAELLSDDD